MKAKKGDLDPVSSTTKPVKIRSVPRHVLDAFDNLVPDDASGQAKAAVVILKHVDQLISGHPGFGLPEDVVYIVKRLVSGLVSHRQRVREGFCSTLQGLLQLHPTTVALTYKAILELCANKKNLSKDETRNFVTGELLGYGALIRAGQVKSNANMRHEIIKRLFWIREKKQYYDIMVSHFLVHMMEKLTRSVVNQEILPVLIPELSGPLEDLTPCKLWLRLVILRRYPDSAPEAFSDTLKAKNYTNIGNIIVKTAINMPNVHPCLSETISSLASRKSTKSANKESQVVQFWLKGLAPYLKEPTTNCLQLLFKGLQLVLLQLKTADDIRKVCNGDVITHLLNVMSLHDKNLSASARGVGSALLQLATTNYEQDNSIQLAIAKVLIKKPGSVRFDQLTGTKLLGQMRLHFTTSTVISVSKIIKKIMIDTTGKIRASDKIGCALFLGRLVSQPRMNTPEHDGWKKEQIVLLMSMALLKPDIKQTVEEYQDIFFRCLGTQMSRIKEYKVTLQYLHEEAKKAVLESKDTETPLITPKVQLTWDKIIARLAEMQEKNKLPIVALDVFQVMYTQMALYLLATSEAKDIIDELDNCYKEAKKTKKSTATSNDETTYEQSWVDKVVELLLTLLPHENNLFRSVAQGVFWLLCPLMTPAALTSIVDVLDPAKQDDLIRVEDDEEDDEEDDDEDLEEDEEEDGEEDDTEEDDDDEDAEEDEEEDMEVDEMFEEELESENEEDEMLFKLKTEMLSVAGDIEDEVDMDSVPQEELDNVNDKLGALIGAYLKQKKKKTLKNKGMEKLQSDDRLLMHFRSRVCDLLELYMKESPNMGLVLSLINPLVTAIIGIDQDRKRQEELLNRIRKLLGMLGKIQKFASNGEATIELVVEEYNTFFNSALKMRDEFNPIIRGCYHLFMRCGCQLLGEEAHDPNNMLIQSYLSHLREIFIENKFNLRTRTFTDICLSDCGALWSVADLMKDFGFDGKLKCYWRTQAIQILYKLYRNEALLSRVDRDVLTVWEKDLSAKICQTIGPSCPLGSIRGQYLAEIFGLLLVIRKNESSKKVTSGINWEEVGSVLVSLRHRLSSKIYKIFRGPYVSIIANLGLSKLIAKPQDKAEKRKSGVLNEMPEGAANGEKPETSDEKVPKKKKKALKGVEDVVSQKNADKQGAKQNLKAGKKLANGDVKEKSSGQSQKKKKVKIPIDSR